jgi:sugar phosphate isomerase/epimerase
MRIGTYARFTYQVRNALQYHPDFIDLRMDFNYSLEFAEIKKLLQDDGVGCSLHLPSNPDWNPMDLSRDIIPFIDLGAEIEAEIVTFHSNLSTLFYSDDEIDVFLNAVPLACDAAKEAGVMLAVETLGLYYTELIFLFDRCPEMKIALDIGHGQILARRNRALGLIDPFLDRIPMINVHDNNGCDLIDEYQSLKKKRDVSYEETRDLARKYDAHLCIGEGKIDFETIFRKLKQRGYDKRVLMMSKDLDKFPEERDKFTKLWLES